MKTKDTTLSDLFMQTAMSLEHSPAEHMECVCQFLRNVQTAHLGFITAFKPENIDSCSRWFDKHSGNSDGVSEKKLEEIKAHRVTAVLLMHELAKDYEEAGFSSEI
jgi:hypothetical protein